MERRVAQDEADAWNARIVPALGATNSSIVRLSDTELLLSLPPTPEYAISSPETLLLPEVEFRTYISYILYMFIIICL